MEEFSTRELAFVAQTMREVAEKESASPTEQREAERVEETARRLIE